MSEQCDENLKKRVEELESVLVCVLHTFSLDDLAHLRDVRNRLREGPAPSLDETLQDLLSQRNLRGR